MKETKKVFIPLTLDNSTKRLFSGRQIIGIVICVLALLMLQISAIRLYDAMELKTKLAGVIAVGADLVGLYIITLIFRKVILRENEMMRNYQDSQRLQKTDISFCWDIFAIKNNRIYYCNGTQGVIVSLSHGYLLDRPSNQAELHREAIKRALGNLTKQGYSFVYFNREVQDSNLESLEETERRLSAFKGQDVYNVANDIIRYTYKVCRSVANTEQEFYLILAGDMSTIDRLSHATKEFLDSLRGSIYIRMDVLADDEIWKFISDQFGTSYIDPASLLTRKFEHNDAQFVFVEEVVHKKVSGAAESDDSAVPIEGEEKTAEQSDSDWLYSALDGTEPDEITNGNEDDFEI